LRSPHSLYNEIRELKERYRIDSFYFIDDLFTLKKDNVYQFCELMIKNNSPFIWGCSSKVNTVDYNILKSMRDAGCIQIDFGVERGSDESLHCLKKGITLNQIKNTFKNCSKLGIRTFANMLVNVPDEDEGDLDDILKLVEEIKPTIVSFNIFTPYPGCEIFDNLCRNIERKDYPLLMEAGDKLIADFPDKFKFAKHSVNFTPWVRKATKKYNRVLSNLPVYFGLTYLSTITHSGRKWDYLRNLVCLAREFINQKF